MNTILKEECFKNILNKSMNKNVHKHSERFQFTQYTNTTPTYNNEVGTL